MNPSPPELFPQRPVRSDFARVPSYRTRRIITVAVVLIVLAVAARMIFGGGGLLPSGEIVTIKAEGAWKQRPQEPGGIDIPHQDVQVYQALDNKDDAKPPVEHLLPPPETPLPVTTTAAPHSASAAAPPDSTAPQTESLTPPKLEIDNIATPVSAAPPAPATDVPVAVPPAAASPTILPPPAAAPVAAIEKAPVPVATVSHPPVAAAPAKAAPPVKAKSLTMAQVLKDVDSTPKTDRIVQLASVQDEASAQAMAEQLQIRYASILGTEQLRVVQANVTGRGTFYRIQSPPVSGDRASGMCAALKKMKAGCILVRP